MKKKFNYTQLKALEKRLQTLNNKGAKAWERGAAKKEAFYKDRFEAEFKEINPKIKIDWPGLYPCFKYKGYCYYNLETLFNAVFF